MTLNKVFSNAIKNAATVLLAMAASTGLATAQTQFMITSVSSGLALDVPALSKLPGTMIQQFTPNGRANQLWTIHRHGTNFYYEIASVNSGLVLDNLFFTTAGAPIQQMPATGGNSQLWQFKRAGGSTGYEIVSANLEPLPEPPGSLPNYANLVLDVPGFSTTPHTLIQQFTENDGTNQQWLFHPQVARNVTVTASNGITVNGFGFAAGSEVCPVFAGGGTTWAAPCATLGPASNGSFSYETGAPSGYQYNNRAPGYVVVIIEDKNQNVMAIGSVSGQVEPNF